MIEIQARVVAVESGYAWVESERRSGCSHCASADTCGVSSLSKLFGVRKQRMRLADPLGVGNGEEIVIGLSEQRLVAAAAVAYMLPLLAMIATTLLSACLGQSPATLAVSSLLGLAGGLFLVRRRLGGGQVLAHYQPVILGRPRSGARSVEFKTRITGVNHE